MSKEYTGLWIPREILSDKNLKHVEKMVLAMADAMSDGIRMSDSTMAEQIGVSERSIAGVLASLIKKGYLIKSGTHGCRNFTSTTQGCEVSTTQGDVVENPNYARLRSQLRKAAKSTTQGCDHKEYKRIESIGSEVEDFVSASPMSYNEFQEQRKRMAQLSTMSIDELD